MIRRAESDADLDAFIRVWNAITPREPSAPVDVIRRRLAREPERLYLLAEADSRAVGLGWAGPTQSPQRTGIVVRVVPEHRRRGIGSALYDALVAHASGLGREWLSGMVFEDDPESVEWVRRRGFGEYGRQVELSRLIGGQEPEPTPPAEIDIVELADEHLAGAYAVAVEAVPDMPVSPRIEAPPFEEWLEEEVPGPVTFVAVEAARVIGYAALLDRVDGLAEHGLTAVLRSHRGRGIGTALKQALLHWAAARGYTELSTWTQDGNAAMQAINLKLGYRPRPAIINVWRRP